MIWLRTSYLMKYSSWKAPVRQRMGHAEEQLQTPNSLKMLLHQGFIDRKALVPVLAVQTHNAACCHGQMWPEACRKKLQARTATSIQHHQGGGKKPHAGPPHCAPPLSPQIWAFVPMLELQMSLLSSVRITGWDWGNCSWGWALTLLGSEYEPHGLDKSWAH